MDRAGRGRGAFITFEGGEGVGKSTHVRRLSDRLTGAGHNVLVTREPGGSAGAEAVRDLLVTGDAERWTPMGEALLMYAARADHLARTIEPARERGVIILCDRFADSSMAYQGIAGGLGADAIAALDALVVGARGPDLTIILDAPVDVGLARAEARGGAARFEAKGAAYHEKVRAAFRDIAAANPERCVVVDARRPVDDIANEIAAVVAEKLGLPHAP